MVIFYQQKEFYAYDKEDEAGLKSFWFRQKASDFFGRWSHDEMIRNANHFTQYRKNEYRTYDHMNSGGKRDDTRTPSQNTNVVPSIEQITGESVMPTDSPLVPLIPAVRREPMTMKDPYFSQGYLQKHIGKKMNVQFLMGANGALVDRTGVLVEVGESYIVLQPIDTDDLLMCDLYSIKFVTIFR